MNIICYKYSLICLVIGGFLAYHAGYASENENKAGSSLITVQVKKNQSIRDISLQYLNNPNLWEDILRANHMKPEEADKVVPGMILRIPVEAISRANTELEKSRDFIQQATQKGAKIFAPVMITQAIRLRDAALEKRNIGEWEDCTVLAKEAAAEAEKALKISLENQDVPAEAVVEYREGSVQSRKPSDTLWKETLQNDILLEGEKIRTLSASYAEILFRDSSRLQLRENAQALIRKMRENPLEDTRQTKVDLIKGDVFALLSGGKKENRFNLDLEGIAMNIESRRFRVGREDQETRIANYEGKLEIEAKGKKVVLKENQGSVVRQNQEPSPPRELLPAPRMLEPGDGDTRFDIKTLLIWKTVPGAEGYLLELSRNASFSKILWEETVRDKNAADRIEKIFPPTMGTGAFYWRVSAISSDKLPGPPSLPRLLRLISDDQPPFLVIQTPEEGTVFSESTAELSGNTEPGATLTIQDQPVDVSSGGAYRVQYKLSPGKNLIIVQATDPAGNTSRAERTVEFVPGTKMNLSFDPLPIQIEKNRFLVRHTEFTLSGQTYPRGRITLSSLNAAFSSKTRADDSGRFQISVRITEQQNEFFIEAASPAGEVTKEQFAAEIDNVPPVIKFAQGIPSVTSQKTVSLSGMIEGGIRLELNGQEISLTPGPEKGRMPFEIQSYQLVPGRNPLQFAASDEAGNRTAIEKDVFLDSDPPELVHLSFSPDKISKSLWDKHKTGQNLEGLIYIRAKDATDMLKILPLTLSVGDYEITAYITRSEGSWDPKEKTSDSRSEKRKPSSLSSAPNRVQPPSLKGSSEQIPRPNDMQYFEYKGIFSIPPQSEGQIKLKCLSLSDYLGNTRELRTENQ
jgi:hypothetical protein